MADVRLWIYYYMLYNSTKAKRINVRLYSHLFEPTLHFDQKYMKTAFTLSRVHLMAEAVLLSHQSLHSVYKSIQTYAR